MGKFETKKAIKKDSFHLLEQKLAEIVTNRDRELSGLVCVVFADDEIVFNSCFGNRYIDQDDAQKNLPINLDTKFRIASISKTVATLGAMQLVEQGLLDLDEDISTYLGFKLRNPHYPGMMITTRMLLSHTSSLRDGETYSLPFPYHLEHFFSPQGVYYENGAHFAQMKEQNDLEPGKYFFYSNLNYGILGTIIEALSGERFDRYMYKHILEPLGIDAGYNVNQLSDKGFNNLAALYQKYSDGVWNRKGPWISQVDDYRGVRPARVIQVNEKALEIDDLNSQTDEDLLLNYVPGTNGTLFSPQGGLRISAVDLLKIMQVFQNEGVYKGKRVVSSESIKAMQRSEWIYDAQLKNGDTYSGQMTEWGLSLKHLHWQYQTAQGLKQTGLWGHFGDAYGLLSAMMYTPQKKAGFIYFIGGVGSDPEDTPGWKTPFYWWEEQIICAVFDEVLQHYLD